MELLEPGCSLFLEDRGCSPSLCLSFKLVFKTLAEPPYVDQHLPQSHMKPMYFINFVFCTSPRSFKSIHYLQLQQPNFLLEPV